MKYHRRRLNSELSRNLRTNRKLSELTGSADEFQVFRYNSSTNRWDPVDARGTSTGEPKVYSTRKAAENSAAFRNLTVKGVNVRVAAADWNGKEESRIRVARRMREQNLRNRVNARRRYIRESQGFGDSIILTYKGFARWDNNTFPNRDFLSVFDDYIVYDNDYRGIRKALETILEDESIEELVEYIDEKHYPNAARAVDSISAKFDISEEKLVVTVSLNTRVTDEIVNEVKDYLNGQMSDGWGEDFEQTPVYLNTIYAAYNEYDIELYANEREAERACLNNNREVEYADEDDYDSNEEWSTTPVDIELYYSFYKPDYEMPESIEIIPGA